MITTAFVVGGLVLLAIALTPRFCPWVYSLLIFHPCPVRSYSTKEVRGIKAEDVFLKNPNEPTLHGWFFNVPDAKLTVMLTHGNGGNLQDWLIIVDLLIQNGCSVFLWDYRGYGMSEGFPMVATACTDGMRAYDYLTKTRGICAEQLVLMGCSLGGGPTCYVAEQRPARGIILFGAFSSLRKVSGEEAPVTKLIPAPFFFTEGMKNAERLRNIKTPVLFVHGQHDDIVNIEHAPINFEAAAGEKELVILPYSIHMDYSQDEELFTSSVRKFLERMKKR